jgi:tetratricopeptide (TPR) repeat protein
MILAPTSAVKIAWRWLVLGLLLVQGCQSLPPAALAEKHLRRGNESLKAGRPEEAIAAYQRALQADPKLPGAHTNLGNALRRAGQIDQAILQYR